VDVDDVPESDDDGVVDSPPMFGQSLDECVAAFESMAAAGVEDVEFEDELVAACATAPPASRAETAKVAMTCLERGNISVHLLSVVCRRSQPTPCKSNL
jgi:hypothetical protein